ncbi:MAG: sulfatase-like hydrolase/transferase [Spirochaetaceae bacterium]
MNKKPNILWIGTDQFRYDTLSTNGNKVCNTPNIDRIAKSGVNFKRAYTTCSLCSPARATMFTGMYAFNHGMGTNCDMYHALSKELDNPETLLHYNLLDKGYSCGFSGKWHVGTKTGPADFGFEGMNIPGYGNPKDFKGFKDYLSVNSLSYTITEGYHFNHENKGLATGVWNGPIESTPTHYLTNFTIDQIKEFAERDQPFMMNCQYWAPHGPHLPCTEFAGRHKKEDMEEWGNFNDNLSEKPNRVKRERDDFYRKHPVTWEENSEIVASYYDFTEMLDFEIGRLLDYLEESGLSEDTIIIFSTDHGDMTGGHGGLLDKGLPYEEVHHIPQIVSWPGVFKSGIECTELVSNMDIMPTILDYLGEDIKSLDGISMLPYLKGEKPENSRKEMFMEFHGLRYLCTQRFIVTDDNWKYIFTPGDYDEVYNLNDDPWEMKNLINDKVHEDKVRELRERILANSIKYNDPEQDCLSKFFGKWESPSGQIDASTMFVK